MDGTSVIAGRRSAGVAESILPVLSHPFFTPHTSLRILFLFKSMKSLGRRRPA